MDNQATLFTAPAWTNDITSESSVLVSDNLNQTKHSVFTYVNFLFTDLRKNIKYDINIFSDGASSQFKVSRNPCGDDNQHH